MPNRHQVLVEYAQEATKTVANASIFNAPDRRSVSRPWSDALLLHILIELRERNGRQAGGAVVFGPTQGGAVGGQVHLHGALRNQYRHTLAGAVGDVVGDGGLVAHALIPKVHCTPTARRGLWDGAQSRRTAN